MKFLITGGCGFIGTYLSQLLSKHGEVYCLDNFTNFLMPNSNYISYLSKRLELLTEAKVKFIRGDVRYLDSIKKTLDMVKPDVVVHLAAIPIAKVCNEQIQNTFSTNMTGTVNLLSSLRDSSVKRFVYASSSFVYGNFKYSCVKETSTTNPIDLYGASKLAGETFTKMFCRRFGIEWVILRPSAVYGALDCNSRVTQIILEKAHYNKPITIDGDGEQRLDFTYVKDTAECFKLAATHPKAKNEIFNATYGKAHTINEFLGILRKFCFPNISVKYIKQKDERPKRGTLKIKKISTMLGYKPQYSLERGIAEYVQFLRENSNEK